MEYELYHYGTKGMRWGVRRYQNADGSLTEAGFKRLDKYRSKELDKVIDKYQVEKLAKQRDKLERKAQTKGGLFIDNRLAKAQYRLFKASGMEYLESQKVYGMSYEDMMSERSAIRKDRGMRFVKDLFNPIERNIAKTNYRVSLEDSIRNEYEARKLTGYRGIH